MPTPKVSIIIPVYNVERYIERCARTLFAQTLDDLEYIFVDDCSPDNSIDVMLQVLEEYSIRKPQVKLIRHRINQGVSRSRQDGLDAATGEYIIHCDPDDWVELDMYEQLYTKAKETDADIVGCDYISETSENNNEIIQNFRLSKIQSVKAILNADGLDSYLWERLVKREFIEREQLKFPNKVSLFEDMYFTIKMHLKTEKIAKLDKPLYHYWESNNISLAKRKTNESIDSQIRALDMIWNEIKFDRRIIKAFNYRKIVTLQSLITRIEFYDPQKWINLTKDISIFNFPSLKSMISPILIRNGLWRLNYMLIKLYRL